MINTKHLTLLAFASSALLFSGCSHTSYTFSSQNGQHKNENKQFHTTKVSVNLVAYPYPYYFDRPYYFFDNMYYYGGRYRNGLYHYGHRQFRHGHYYNRGYRYYKGRRYRARRGQYGYYTNRNNYQSSHQYRKYINKRQRRLDRGRDYNRGKIVPNYKNKYIKKEKINRLNNNVSHSNIRRSKVNSIAQRKVRRRTTRQRPQR